MLHACNAQFQQFDCIGSNSSKRTSRDPTMIDYHMITPHARSRKLSLDALVND